MTDAPFLTERFDHALVSDVLSPPCALDLKRRVSAP